MEIVAKLTLAGDLKLHSVTSLLLAKEYNLDRFEPEWAGYIGVNRFNAMGFDGYGEYCAIFDTGIDRASPAIKENFHYGFTTIAGDRYLCNKAAFKDSYFHGTAVAGCVIQTMPQVGLINAKCFDQTHKAYNNIDWWIKAIEMLHKWQDKKGIYGVVCNMSLGITPAGDRTQYPELWCNKIDLLAEAIRISVERYNNYWCAAGGNEAQRGSPANYPAAFDDYVFAIGSVKVERITNGHKIKFRITRSDFSNINNYVDYVCLGEDFWTFLANSAYDKFKEEFLVMTGNGIRVKQIMYKHQPQWCVEMDGTSFGCPAFAGMLVGIVQEYKKKHSKLPTLEDVRVIVANRSSAYTDTTERVWSIPWLYRTDDTGMKRLING